MDIIYLLLILLPTLFLVYINFKKFFAAINPFVVFFGCMLSFVVFFSGIWIIVDLTFGEQVSWIIYIFAVLSLLLYVIALFFRCVMLQIEWSKKNWFWFLPIALLIEIYCIRFIYFLYC